MVLRFVLAASLLAAGCRFGFAGVPVDGGPDLAMAPDLAPGFCDVPSLIVCYRFEDAAAATVARDESPNHRDLTLTAATEIPNGHEGGALAMTSGSLAHAAHDAIFDAQKLTYEMWLRPRSLPQTGARAGLVDEDGEYGLFVYPPGVLTCSLAGVVASSPPNAIVVDAWQKAACSYDGAAVRLYINDALVAMTPDSAPVASGQPNGLSIGSNSPSGDDFDGLLDDVRIFSTAR